MKCSSLDHCAQPRAAAAHSCGLGSSKSSKWQQAFRQLGPCGRPCGSGLLCCSMLRQLVSAAQRKAAAEAAVLHSFIHSLAVLQLLSHHQAVAWADGTETASPVHCCSTAFTVLPHRGGGVNTAAAAVRHRLVRTTAADWNASTLIVLLRYMEYYILQVLKWLACMPFRIHKSF